eukprot:1146468-Pelagomonas_calceolata.AAC.6
MLAPVMPRCHLGPLACHNCLPLRPHPSRAGLCHVSLPCGPQCGSRHCRGVGDGAQYSNSGAPQGEQCGTCACAFSLVDMGA